MKKATIISTNLRPDTIHRDLYDGGEGNYIPLGCACGVFREESIGIDDTF